MEGAGEGELWDEYSVCMEAMPPCPGELLRGKERGSLGCPRTPSLGPIPGSHPCAPSLSGRLIPAGNAAHLQGPEWFPGGFPGLSPVWSPQRHLDAPRDASRDSLFGVTNSGSAAGDHTWDKTGMGLTGESLLPGSTIPVPGRERKKLWQAGGFFGMSGNFSCVSRELGSSGRARTAAMPGGDFGKIPGAARVGGSGDSSLGKLPG